MESNTRRAPDDLFPGAKKSCVGGAWTGDEDGEDGERGGGGGGDGGDGLARSGVSRIGTSCSISCAGVSSEPELLLESVCLSAGWFIQGKTSVPEQE